MAVLALAVAACAEPNEPVPTVAGTATILQVEAPRFVDERGFIRPRYTCEGLGVSPELAWTEAPEGTVTQVLLMDDPDAPGGSFTHWLLYDIPVETNRFFEAAGPNLDELPLGAKQGENGYGAPGYGVPCPPRGETHLYVIHIFALDTALALLSPASRGEILAAMDGHVIAHGTLSGLFRR